MIMSNPNNRVVVTGIGIVSPLGLDTATTWANLIAGNSGIDYVTLFDAESLDTRFGGEVKSFNAADYMSPKEVRHTDRFTQLAVAASREAIDQSGILVDSGNQDDFGVFIGSGIGGLSTLFEQTKVLLDRGPGRITPFLVPMMISDMAAAQVSISLGLKGPNLCTTSACSSGADAIGAAYEMIKHDEARAMLAGGSESIMNQLGFAAFNALKALSTRNSEPKLASRPFDTERDGFVISEGAAVLVLENLNHARKRGAEILAEILAYGASADAFHITQPIENGEGAARAIKTALKRADIGIDGIDYINAHGTSTQLNDRMETEAIKSVFGEHAYTTPVSSTKSMTGHMIGGAGAIEASFCILAIRNGIIPPTINLVNPDPDCDLDYVPNEARHTEVNIALSNSFGFGGHNSTLILGRYSEA
ncbi:MAG TPA: beta-ketoacyl-ACP synthase II [Dehalococcoidia bacterium]|nr:beta-ketoacyl-ACP synthase II [Dehalococcoidia bacterium]